ncbi:MAG: translational machinery protein [Betaproteobacteria bacterium]|nr:translational machinery protein [Betaproteobacteria bacterium]
MGQQHAVVWVDHARARVLHLDIANIEKSVIEPAQHPHLHHKCNTVGSGKAPEDQHYYHGIAQALADAREILITGPGSAKLELFKHLQHHDAAIAARVVGIETSDHPTDGQIVDHARHYFEAKDRMLGI